MESAATRNWMTREEAEAFIGDNASFYLDKWKAHSETTLKGWNWAAMFFGVEWMAYRKMYAEALFSFVISTFISFIAALFLFDLDGDFWGYLFRTLIGVFGNALYRKKALRTLHKTGAQNDAERLQTLAKRGGVSTVSVVVLVLLEVAFSFVLFIFT